MNKSSAEVGRGRRPGQPNTRDQILAAARRRFLTDGYQATSLRSIAADAEVDTALVSYYFGSKQGVFGAAMALTANPAEVLAAALPGDLAGLPERALRALLQTWDDEETGTPLRAMLGNVGQNPAVARVLREVVEREIIGAIAARLSGPHREDRAAMFGTALAGLIFGRYILRIGSLVSMSADDVVRRMAPMLAAALRP
jgi:AcrR family transcriptional regulator